MRYHIVKRLVGPGVRYKMIALRDQKIEYFEDETLMGEILEALERKWYRRLLKWPWFSWEVEANDREIVYYFWAPDSSIGNEIRKKILGKHPTMEIVEVEKDLNINNKFITASSMKLNRDYTVPIKTFFNERIDTQAAIVNSISDLEEGETVLIQILVKPARRYQKHFDKALSIVKNWDKEKEYEKIELFETNIAGKQNKQLGHVVIRIMVGAKNNKDGVRILHEVQRSFGQFNSEALNSFRPIERFFHIKPLLIYDIKNRLYPIFELKNRRVVLNIGELSGLTRLPSEEVNNSRLTRLHMTKIEAPPNVIEMSREAKEKENKFRFVHIGKNNYRMKDIDTYLDLVRLSNHLLAIGGSGQGKSVFLNNLFINLLKLKSEGLESGFFFIDPLGGVAQTIASNIPENLLDKVNFVQPDPLAEKHFPLNIFDVDFATTEHSIAKNISDAVGRIWPDGWGVRPERNFLRGGIALQRLGKANVVNLEKLLRNPLYAYDVAKSLENHKDLVEDGIIDYFLELAALGAEDAKPTDKRRKTELTESTLNKLDHFILSKMLKGMMGSKTSGFRWRESMDRGYINILDLSKIQNEHEKRMLGSVALTMNYQAAISRPSEAENLLYPMGADEIPMFLANNLDVINDMADRTRQKNVPIVGASQGIITQLDKKIADAIGRNFNNQIAFRVNHDEDAAFIANLFNDKKLTAVNFKETMENHAYVRIGVGRSASRPFSVLMDPPIYLKPNESIINELVKDTLDRAMKRENEAIKKEQEQKEKVTLNIYNENKAEEKENIIISTSEKQLISEEEIESAELVDEEEMDFEEKIVVFNEKEESNEMIIELNITNNKRKKDIEEKEGINTEETNIERNNNSGWTFE